jgi:hypothetical protein
MKLSILTAKSALVVWSASRRTMLEPVHQRTRWQCRCDDLLVSWDTGEGNLTNTLNFLHLPSGVGLDNKQLNLLRRPINFYRLIATTKQVSKRLKPWTIQLYDSWLSLRWLARVLRHWRSQFDEHAEFSAPSIRRRFRPQRPINFYRLIATTKQVSKHLKPWTIQL